LIQAIQLIITRDPALMQIVAVSLQVTGTALLFSTLASILLGSWLGLTRFLGRQLVIALLYTGMGFPPVVVGLFARVYRSLSSRCQRFCAYGRSVHLTPENNGHSRWKLTLEG
jgi:tungstate transport system permease protein